MEMDLPRMSTLQTLQCFYAGLVRLCSASTHNLFDLNGFNQRVQWTHRNAGTTQTLVRGEYVGVELIVCFVGAPSLFPRRRREELASEVCPLPLPHRAFEIPDATELRKEVVGR